MSEHQDPLQDDATATPAAIITNWRLIASRVLTILGLAILVCSGLPTFAGSDTLIDLGLFQSLETVVRYLLPMELVALGIGMGVLILGLLISPRRTAKRASR